MNVLIAGSTGRVGRALVRLVPSQVNLMTPTHRELDVTDVKSVLSFVDKESPDIIINAAAYLQADNAEKEPNVAGALNTEGARHLAFAARGIGARLIQLSTAYVFDGDSAVPYCPDFPTNPLSIYGLTKRDGENAANSLLAGRCAILRTSWLYSRDGPDFLSTLLRTLEHDGSAEAVADQIGTPTYADAFAQVIWRIALERDFFGVFHWTDAGVASWYDFAVAVAEEAAAIGLIGPGACVKPTSTRTREGSARRPRCSLLDSTSLTSRGLSQMHWRTRLRLALEDIKISRNAIAVPSGSSRATT